MVGLDLAFCLQGSLVDGRIIDTSLTRDPLVIELGQKQVIPGMWPVPLPSSEPKPLLNILTGYVTLEQPARMIRTPRLFCYLVFKCHF